MTTFVQPSSRSTGDIVTASIWNTDLVTNMAALAETEFVWTVDGGGALYTTGVHRPIRARFPCTVVAAWMLHNAASTSTFKIHKTAYASYTPSPNADITNGGFSSSAANKAEDTSLTGWTKSIAAGDVLHLEVTANDVAFWTVVGLDVSYG